MSEEFKCPRCLEYVADEDVDYSFVTLEDGIYQCKDKKDISYGMGCIMSDIVLKEKIISDESFYLETYVNGICAECAKEII